MAIAVLAVPVACLASADPVWDGLVHASSDSSVSCPPGTFALTPLTAGSAANDARLRTFVAFIGSRAPAARRGGCLHRERTLAQAYESEHRDRAVQPPLQEVNLVALEALQVQLLTSAAPADQLAGALAARADFGPETGRRLLALVTPDHEPIVRSAALRSLPWAMNADVERGTSQSLYDGPLTVALHDTNTGVVISALHSWASIKSPRADASLLAFGRSANPVLRVGALEALDYRNFVTPATYTLIENGLRDPEIDVRSAAMYIPLSPSPTQLELLAGLAAHAKTAAEREDARESLAAYEDFIRRVTAN